MGEPQSPCLPVGAAAAPSSLQLARELARGLEYERRAVMRVCGVGTGLGLGGGTLGYGAIVMGMPLLPMAAFAAGVALSSTMLAMALLSTCMDGAVAWRWRRTVSRHGVDEVTAARALCDVRDALVPRE
jgi:hypothetical protein